MRFLLRGGAVALAVSLLGTSSNGSSASFDDAVRTAMQPGHVPGAQVAVVRDGRPAFARDYGLANVAQNKPVTDDSQFEIGSITKQFTAAAILQLKEQGKLQLSDPLGKYMPQYAIGKNVTIEQMLYQVSGIPDYLNETPDGVTIVSTRPGGVDAALALIKDKPLHFAPGTQWRYSNTNYLLLGAIVAKASGVPYEQYVREHIFEKAGMTHSAFVRDEDSLPDMATGYYTDKAGKTVPARRIRDGWAGGAGAIVSTASDVAKWDEAFFAGKIISNADVKLATTPDTLPSGRSTSYGFGWGMDTLDGQPLIWHNGGSLGFISQNDYFPTLHEAVIVLTNDREAHGSTIADRVFETLHPDIAAAAAKPAAGEDPKITALAREWLHYTQTGTLDKSQLTAGFAAFLTPDRVKQAEEQLAPLGDPVSLVYRGEHSQSGVTAYTYRVTFKTMTLSLILMMDKSGKIAGLGFQAV